MHCFTTLFAAEDCRTLMKELEAANLASLVSNAIIVGITYS